MTQCSICGKRFRTAQRRNAHARLAHPQDKYDRLASVAADLGGLRESQKPGLAALFRIVAKDAIEEARSR